MNNEIYVEMSKRGLIFDERQKETFDEVSDFMSGLMTEYDFGVIEGLDFENLSGYIKAGFSAFEVLSGDIVRLCNVLKASSTVDISTESVDVTYMTLTIPNVLKRKGDTK